MKLGDMRSVRSICSLFILCLAGLVLTGCQAPGETTSEVARRHKRVIRVNTGREFQADLDTWMMLDKPSKLTGHIVR